MTPEEYETCLGTIEEFKTNFKYYSLIFIGMSLSFTYWQRAFLPKFFYSFSVALGCLAGGLYAFQKTGYYFTERLDMLGKEYELSRMVKQDIFDTRPDLDSGMRA